jgi:UDP-glucose 4-epimerase
MTHRKYKARLLEGKRVLVTGGTGSLGKALTKRLLSCELGRPGRITIFSRDEAKQHYMRLEYLQRRVATDDVIYHNFKELLVFRIGDIRDFHSVASALRETDVVFHAAALKQVPTCEYFPTEAVRTNVLGAENITRAIQEFQLPVETVIGVSTDKACKPVNVMGMTKAIQERVLLQANMQCPATRFICVRYGNVISSRGSVVPLFVEQIRKGGPVTITRPDMTRFLLTLDHGVDTLFSALDGARPGELYVPKVRSARVIDVARVLIGNRKVRIVFTGIRPGEKVHEILISEEESSRTLSRGDYYVIQSILPDLRAQSNRGIALSKEFSSADSLMSPSQLEKLLESTEQSGEQEAS